MQITTTKRVTLWRNSLSLVHRTYIYKWFLFTSHKRVYAKYRCEGFFRTRLSDLGNFSSVEGAINIHYLEIRVTETYDANVFFSLDIIERYQ